MKGKREEKEREIILRHKMMSKSISYSEVLEENTGKRNQTECTSFFPFSFSFWFQRLILLVLALLTKM